MKLIAVSVTAVSATESAAKIAKFLSFKEGEIKKPLRRNNIYCINTSENQDFSFY